MEDKKQTLTQQFNAANSGKFFSLPRWWADLLTDYDGLLIPLQLLFLAIWLRTVACKEPWAGRLSFTTSQRDLAKALGIRRDSVSRYLAAMQTMNVVSWTVTEGSQKAELTIRTRYLFDSDYMEDFCCAVHEVLAEGGERMPNHQFCTLVKKEFDGWRTARRNAATTSRSAASSGSTGSH